MNREMRLEIDRIMDLADTTLQDLAVAGHQKGFTRLMVHLDDGGLIDMAEEVYDYNYKIAAPLGWKIIFEVGTGLKECKCENCITGCDPWDWGADEEYESVEKEIEKNLLMLGKLTTKNTN